MMRTYEAPDNAVDKFEIDDLEVRSERLPVRRQLKLAAKLMKHIAPIFKALQDSGEIADKDEVDAKLVGKVLETALKNIDEDEMDYIVEKTFYCSTVLKRSGDKPQRYELSDPKNIDRAFDKLGSMLKVLQHVVMLNFADFFSEADHAAEGAAKEQE